MHGKSLRDIAKLAGVSVYTVSLALRNRSRVAPATRKRIQEIAKAAGYAPNAGLAELMARTRAASSPAYQSTLAYLDAAPGVRNYAFDTYRAGVIERAGQLGYRVDVFEVDNLVEPPTKVQRILRSRGITGIVIMWPHHQGIPESWNGLWKDRKCVFLAARPESPQFALAMIDHFQVGAMAYHKAVEAGHQRIGIVQYEWMESVSEGRFMGGIYAQQRLAPKTSFTVLNAGGSDERALLRWYHQHRSDCIITMYDSTAGQLGLAGVDVPGEVSLIYWDVFPRWHGIYAGPEQQPAPIARAAVDLVVQKLHTNEEEDGEPQRCVMVEPVWRVGPTLRKRA